MSSQFIVCLVSYLTYDWPQSIPIFIQYLKTVITDESKKIDEMETWEILVYLRFQRWQHILVNFSRDMYETELNVKFTEKSWNDFLIYCDGVDNQVMFSRANKYINQWKGNCLLNDFLDND